MSPRPGGCLSALVVEPAAPPPESRQGGAAAESEPDIEKEISMLEKHLEDGSTRMERIEKKEAAGQDGDSVTEDATRGL